MRVLLISHSLVTRSNHRLPAALAGQNGLDLHVLAPHRWPEESRDVQQEQPHHPSYHVHLSHVLTRRYHPNLFLYDGALARVLRHVQPDILDVHEEPFSAAAGQTLLLRRALAPRATFTFYSWQNILKRYPPPFAQIEAHAYRSAPIASVATGEIGAVLRRKGYTGEVVINPPGIDDAIFCPLPAEGAITRARFGLAADAPVLGYLGRLTPEKGLEDLFAALALLPDSTRLLVAGGGDAAWARERAAAYGVAARITFVGALERPATPAFFAALTALVVPSRTTAAWKEQFGRVIPEAAFCGVPVIGSSSGAIPEVVGPGGLIVPEQQPRALANAAQLLFDDPGLAHTLGARGRARALREFTWTHVAATRYALYQRLAEVQL